MRRHIRLHHPEKVQEEKVRVQEEKERTKLEKKKKVRCTECNRLFAHAKGLLEHQNRFRGRSCISDRKGGARDPSKPVAPSLEYVRVIDPSDGILKIQCQEKDCGAFYKSREAAKTHLATMHSKDQDMEKCLVCPVLVPTDKILFHLKTNHSKGGCYTCHVCSKEFKHTEKFTFHLTSVHQIGEYKYKCDQCDKVFHVDYLLAKHKRLNHESPRVICDICGEELLNDKGLEIHLQSVHNLYKITEEDKIKKCDKCEIVFKDPKEFNNHLKTCLDDPKDFKCKFCDSVWVSHLSLEQHIIVDHQMLKSVCDICGVVTKNSSTVQSHKNNVHEKIHKFVCHICAKSTNSKEKFTAHMINAHGIGEKQFKCDQCDKSFAIKSILKTHYESHHAKTTLYQCEQCPKTFWMKEYLRTHVKMIHENHRPHKCDICQQGFYYKRDVISHKKHVHNIHL